MIIDNTKALDDTRLNPSDRLSQDLQFSALLSLMEPARREDFLRQMDEAFFAKELNAEEAPQEEVTPNKAGG